MYKKIIFFDFDGTLFHTPEPLQGEKIWFDKTGKVDFYKFICGMSLVNSADLAVNYILYNIY